MINYRGIVQEYF